MKIVQIVESFGGGVYSFLVDLCNKLSETNEVIILYSEREETPSDFKSDFNKNIKFIKVDMKLKNLIVGIIRIGRIIRELNPDVVHCHSSKAGVFGRISSKLSGYKGKVFYNPHGLAFIRQDISKFKRFFFLVAEMGLAHMNGVCVGVSKSEAKEISKFTSKYLYINNGIDLNKEYKKMKVNNKIKIGTVGRITYQKNPKLFNEIALNNPKYDFFWFGDGEMNRELQAPNITVSGWLPRGEVLKKVMELDIYIQTSLWEGLPISVIEAMNLGKPLLVNECVGNIDTVKNGYNGFICKELKDFNCGLEKIIKNYAVFSENSFDNSKEFNKEIMINKYSCLYSNE